MLIADYCRLLTLFLKQTKLIDSLTDGLQTMQLVNKNCISIVTHKKDVSHDH